MGLHHFVLIHGGCHGAWAWWKTVDRLQRAGCPATALDLTSAGSDTTDPNSVTSFAQYHKPAVDFIVSLPDDEKMFKDTLLGEACRYTFANGTDKPPTYIFFVNTAPFFYNGCAPEDIERASTSTKPLLAQAIAKAVSYKEERHGRVPSVFVRGLRDKTVTPAVQNYVVEHSAVHGGC